MRFWGTSRWPRRDRRKVDPSWRQRTGSGGSSGGFWDKFYGVRWKVYRKGEDPKFSDESSDDEASVLNQ